MIIKGKEVKQKLLQGIDLVAETVKPTLGPQAKTVILTLLLITIESQV